MNLPAALTKVPLIAMGCAFNNDTRRKGKQVMNIKKTFGFVVFASIVFTSSICFGEAHFDFEANANQDTLEIQLGRTWEEDISTFLTSISMGVLYSDDIYTIANAKFGLGTTNLFDNLTIQFGFKGVIGTVDEDNRDADVGAVGAFFSLLYPFNVPLIRDDPDNPLFDISMEICWAPSPVSFGDLDRYNDFKTALGFRILPKTGTIMVGFRSVNAKFNKDFNNWEKKDSAFFLGFKFSL